MRKFFLGFAAGIIAVAVGTFIYLRFGFMDPRADIPVNSLERAIAMPSVDAAVDRHAPEAQNPLPPTEANLMAGMKTYQTNCSACHGDIGHRHGVLADSLYPRAPQFLEDAPDMPENQNFYIIRHGIRLTGMPAWGQSLSEPSMWQVTTFLSHMSKLPLSVSDAWKGAVGGDKER